MTDLIERIERAEMLENLADALGCFWNAAIGSARGADDFTVFRTVISIAEGTLAVQLRLEEIAAALRARKVEQ